jgi:hypothetical protein
MERNEKNPDTPNNLEPSLNPIVQPTNKYLLTAIDKIKMRSVNLFFNSIFCPNKYLNYNDFDYFDIY